MTHEEFAEIMRTAKCKLPLNSLYDYSKAKKYLIVQLIAIQGNEATLASIPFTQYSDMALVYLLMSDKGEAEPMLITNEILHHYGLTAEQLHHDALESASERYPAKIQIMKYDEEGNAVAETPQTPRKGNMFVVSSLLGAGCIFYPGLLDKAADMMDSSYYILPATREHIILLRDKGVSVKSVSRLVKVVNRTEVSPENQLTDSVYYYDRNSHKFMQVS